MHTHTHNTHTHTHTYTHQSGMRHEGRRERGSTMIVALTLACCTAPRGAAYAVTMQPRSIALASAATRSKTHLCAQLATRVHGMPLLGEHGWSKSSRWGRGRTPCASAACNAAFSASSYDELVVWLREAGGQVHSAVEVTEDDCGAGRGLLVACNVAQGDPLVVVPEKAQLFYSLARDGAVFRDPVVCVT